MTHTPYAYGEKITQKCKGSPVSKTEEKKFIVQNMSAKFAEYVMHFSHFSLTTRMSNVFTKDDKLSIEYLMINRPSVPMWGKY